MMKRISRTATIVAVALLCLSACSSKPEVTPMSLAVPPPPDPHPGAIRVYGDHLSRVRVNHVTSRIRAVEPDLLQDYEDYLHDAPGAEGRVQVRIGVNHDGKVVQVVRVYSEVSSGLTMLVRQRLEKLEFEPGPEAYAYYTMGFRPDPFEVLQQHAEFDGKPPALVAVVENRSAFTIPAVAATVTVMGPDAAKALRIYRRRFAESFAPGERRELRIPVGGEWATERNSFLVTVRPSAPPKTEADKESE